MSIKGIIFDLDGTLLDTNAIHVEAWHNSLGANGWSVPHSRIAHEIGRGGKELVLALVGELPEAQYEALGQKHDSEFLKLIASQKIESFAYVRLLTTLRDRGIKLALCTGTGKSLLQELFGHARTTLPGFFDAIISGDDTEKTKPHGSPVLKAAEALQLCPTECGMVGDTVYDSAAGLAAGVATVGVETGVFKKDELLKGGCRIAVSNLDQFDADLEETLNVLSPSALPLERSRLEFLVREALESTKLGMKRGEVPCGAVIARPSGPILACAHNEMKSRNDKLSHAALEVIRKVAHDGYSDSRDLILAVTHEPCHLCVSAAMEIKIETIVYGIPDEKGGGTRSLERRIGTDLYWPRVVGGICMQECKEVCSEPE